jgi:hypothetical protein
MTFDTELGLLVVLPAYLCQQKMVVPKMAEPKSGMTRKVGMPRMLGSSGRTTFDTVTEPELVG